MPSDRLFVTVRIIQNGDAMTKVTTFYLAGCFHADRRQSFFHLVRRGALRGDDRRGHEE